jgi:hypothetical protein
MKEKQHRRPTEMLKCIIFVVRVFFALKYFSQDKASLDDGFRRFVCPVLSIIENGLQEVPSRKRANTMIRGNSESPARKRRPTKKSNSLLRKKRAKSSGADAASESVGNSKMLPATVVVLPNAPSMPHNLLMNGERVLAQPMVLLHDDQAQTTLKETNSTAEHAWGSNPTMDKGEGRSGGAAFTAGGSSKRRLPMAKVVPPNAAAMPKSPGRLGSCEPVLRDGQAETTTRESDATAEQAGDGDATMSKSVEISGTVASKVGNNSKMLPTASISPPDATLMPLDLLANGTHVSEQPLVPHNGQAKTTPNESNAAPENAAMSIGAKITNTVASKVGGCSRMLPTVNNIVPANANLMPSNLLANGDHVLRPRLVVYNGQAKTSPKEPDARDANPTPGIAQNEGYDRIKATIQRQIDLHLQGAAGLRKKADDLRKEADDRTKQADDRTQQAQYLLKSLEDLESLKQEDRNKEKLIEAKVKNDIYNSLFGPDNSMRSTFEQ